MSLAVASNLFIAQNTVFNIDLFILPIENIWQLLL